MSNQLLFSVFAMKITPPTRILLFLLLTVFAACSSNTNRSSGTSPAKLASLSCDSCLRLLVMSADIDPVYKNKQLMEDGLTDGKLLIKIYHENEVEPGAVFDAADCRLSIHIKEKALYQDIISDDTEVKVKCDQAILDHYIAHCLPKAQSN